MVLKQPQPVRKPVKKPTNVRKVNVKPVPVKQNKPIKKEKEPFKLLTEEGEQLFNKVANTILGRSKHKKGKPPIDIKNKKPVSVGMSKPNTNNPKLNNETKSQNKHVVVKKKQTTLTEQPKPTTQRRKFNYTRPSSHGERKPMRRDIEIEEVKEEKVIVRRAKLETVRDLNEVSFFEKINLVSYFNQKESGKLDEREVREEYMKNTKLLQKENSLKYFLLESARRNLEYGEFPEIKLQIDPRMKEELENCLSSKLLSSYIINIERQDEILTKMNVDPIIISMKLKVMV